jgi:Zn-dependent metalloprotease
MPHRCFIVPPHLFKAISESSANSDAIRQAAQAALSSQQDVAAKRKNCIEAVIRNRRSSLHPAASSIIPVSMLRHISDSGQVNEASRAATLRTLEHTIDLLTPRQDGETAVQPTTEERHPRIPDRITDRMVYDARHALSEAELPGKLVRAEGDKNAKDKTVNEAYDNVGIVLDFYKNEFGWKSIDNKNADIISSVHFGEQYENACKK